MAYRDIDNLYKNQDILMFKECYAMEKIHGTSAHVIWKEDKLTFFSGGVEYLQFKNLFDLDLLKSKFEELGKSDVTVFGEAYGGKCQGMSHVYGKELRFVVFEVRMGEHTWLRVPDAESVARSLGFDFVPYERCSTDMDTIDLVRSKPSEQAAKCGITEPRVREGIVLRPLIELRKNNGDRIIAKHKNDEYRETRTKREVDQKDLKVLEQAQQIAEEWVTEMRLTHVLDKFPGAEIEQTGDVVRAMIEDVEKESEGEIVKSRQARKAIGKRAAVMFKERLKERLYEREE
jgi:hypothetical protein